MKFQQKQESVNKKAVSLKLLNNRVILTIGMVFLVLLAFFGGVFLQRKGLLGEIRTKLSTQVDTSMAEAEKNLSDEVRLYENNGLPTLAIDLKFKYYRQMLEKRDEALKVGILQTTDDDFVPATISYNNGPKMDIKMRLKGDWTDHLKGKKWSFRIHLTNSDDQILGFRQFSIQTPETRNFLYEWAFHENLINEGVMTTRYDFVNVMLNGELLGVYGIEENFAAELVESQGRRQGVILRFDEDNLWNKWAYFYENGTNFMGSGWSYTTEKTADITTFQTGKIRENETLAAEAETARSLLESFESGKLSASEVFDVKLMGRFFALSDLWAACHGTNWHNLRFFYNPITARLEPVVFDAIPFSECKQDATKNFIFDAGNSIFDDDEIRRAYAQELYRITRPGYIQTLRDQYDTEAQGYTSALLKEYAEKGLDMSWQRLIERQQFLNLWFSPPNPVKGAYSLSGINPGDTVPVQLRIELTNLAPVPVDVVGFEINGSPVDLGSIQPGSLASYKDSKVVPNYAQYSFNFEETPKWADPDHLPEIKAVIRLAGIPNDLKIDLNGAMTPAEISLGPLPPPVNLNDLLAEYPFLSASPTGDQILVSPGVWDITGDLVIPSSMKLIISAGTVLRFDPDSVIFTHGVLDVLGTENDPVLLTAKDPNQGWGGIVLLSAPGESIWKYAKIENTHGIARQGWILTGGITIFQSAIQLDHAIIGNNQTEDAINVVHGKFTFLNTLFENTFADAFDSDFSDGDIRDCTFQNIQGDAVDISGTHATASNLTITNITDKGFSIGEDSHIIADNIHMDTVGIGVASKDLSSVEIKDSDIRNTRFSGLAAYIKKPVFGPASIIAENVTITDTEQLCVVQKGSSILLNGKDYPGQELDVDKLYAQGILGN
jgi:hypothetical protein